MEKAILLLSKIEGLGYKAYLVGGSVRDYLLKRDSFDIDISTNMTPNLIMEHFKSVPTGLKFGTVLVFYEGSNYEVTTFRKDLKYYDNRHPEGVVFSNKLEEDVLRRDFTINGLYMDKNYQVIDLVDGKQDLDNKVIKAIGNPNDRFKEDALRMLRAFYLVSKLDFEIEKDTFLAIHKNKELIKNISAERIIREIEKINEYPNSIKAFNQLVDSGLYLYLPGLQKGIKYLSDHDLKLSDNEFFSLSFYLNGSIDKFWKLSNRDKDLYKNVISLLNEKEINEIVLFEYKLEEIKIAAVINELLKVHPISETEIINKYLNMPIKSDDEIAISNHDIMNILNKKPGPWLKRIRNKIKDEILTNNLTNDYESLVKYIETRKR